MKPIDWRSIRTHNGSQYGGFEELCTQLARSEKQDDPKAKFRRLGNPDGGIECYWEDSEGNKWGWQAKYYLGDIRWCDITKSIKTALKEHPTLTRYYVCIPKNQTLKMDEIWKDHVTEWKALAKNKTNREVEFIWWGDSELSDKLIRPEHAGRILYWFNEHMFDNDWFKKRVERAIKTAGPRYTPELHVGLPVADKLENLGRTDRYIDKIKECAEEIENAENGLYGSVDLGPDDDFYIESQRDTLRGSLQTVFEYLDKFGPEPVGGPTCQEIFESATSAMADADEYSTCLPELVIEHRGKRKKRRRRRKSDRQFRLESLHSESEQAYEALQSTLDTIGEIKDKRLMIISGTAGTGKTHLLCDVAKKRVEEGLPTVLLMGQRFTSTDEPWSQAREHLDLPGVSKDEFFGALEAAAQAKGRRALLMIDAVNEGQGRTIWPAHLEDLLEHTKNSPWIAVVLSVRSTRKNAEIPRVIPKIVKDQAVIVEHKGFELKEYEAIKTFFTHYGLELPSTPILNPEFSKPLFLKIICKGLHGKGETRLPRGFHGISQIFNLYLDDVNKRMVSELREDEREKFVRRALNKFVQRLVDKEQRWLSLEVAKKEIAEILPGRNYENSLYHRMVSEDLLIEDSNEDGSDSVQISYERFADHIIVDFLLEKYLNREKPELAFVKSGKLASLLDMKHGALGDLLEALSIQVPERTGKELIELVPSLIERQDARDAFQQSLIWRNLDAFSDATDEILNRSLKTKKDEKGVWDMFLTVATVPNHRYNAHFLHSWLKRYTMPERDLQWSIYLSRAFNDRQSAVNRLLDWVSRTSPDMELEIEAVELAGITLTWTLTSASNFLRDRATKALVFLMISRLETLLKILKLFVDTGSKKFQYVNDPYVAERLYAVAYGIAMRSWDVLGMGNVAQWVYENVFADGKPPVHILLRDYARGVIERALYLKSKINVRGDLIEPPYESVFPDIPTRDEIKQLGEVQRRISYGDERIDFPFDFVRKVIRADQSSNWLSLRLNENQRLPIKDNKPLPRFESIQTQRYVFKRVFELGWNIEYFGEFDELNIENSNTFLGRTNRIGKKYQLIAYHEIMAYISDHFQYLVGDGKVGKYEGPWQGDFRDIDPSITRWSKQGGTYGVPHKQSWWSGESYTEWKGNEINATWLERKDDIPGIANLLRNILKVTTKNKNWLNLNGSFFWGTKEMIEIALGTIEDEYEELGARKLELNFTSCFVKNNELKLFMNWLKELGSARDDMLIPPEIKNVFFGEYGWSPAFKLSHGRKFDKPWPLDECPVGVRVTSFDYAK